MMAFSAQAAEYFAKQLYSLAVEAQGLLHRMLSVQSHISTSSTLARTYQEATESPTLSHFKEIGRGTCGKVFSITGTPKVVKVPLNESQVKLLYNDACMHRLVEEAFLATPSKYTKHLNLPKFEEWIASDATGFWTEYGDRFPEERPSFCLMSERIFPLPNPLRKALVRSFALSAVKESEVLMLDTNKDCLVRIYLGRRMHHLVRRDDTSFKLRNFELHVNEMEVLDLDLEHYSATMADALAIIHWKAGVDGDDVEFVLGSTPITKKAPTAAEMLKTSELVSHRSGSDVLFTKRSVGIWILDFNNCKQIRRDAGGVELLVRSFWHNDPYTPRPSADNPVDMELWKHFRERYLDTSREFLPKECWELPRLFLDKVEEEGERWKASRIMAGEGSLFTAITK